MDDMRFGEPDEVLLFERREGLCEKRVAKRLRSPGCIDNVPRSGGAMLGGNGLSQRAAGACGNELGEFV